MTPGPTEKRHFAHQLRLLASLGASLASIAISPGASGQPAVFDGPSVAYAEPIGTANAAGARALRTIHVEERVGVDRRNELVRVPLFFSAGECRSLDELAIVSAAAGRTPTTIPWQADDIRRGPDGGLSRVHLWFPIDLAPHERRTFELVRRTSSLAVPDAPPLAVEQSDGELRFQTEAGVVAVTAAGSLRRIQGEGVDWNFGAAGAFPSVSIAFPKSGDTPAVEVRLDRNSGKSVTEWSTGPLFAKVRTRITGPAGLALEQEIRIPRDGHEVIVSTALFVGDRPGGIVEQNALLEGELDVRQEAVDVERIPAGVRASLRAEHAYTVSALSRTSASGSLLAVPLVIGGTNGQWSADKNGHVALMGQQGLRQGGEGEKESLHAYWSEVRLVPAATNSPEKLWSLYRDHVQPLVAIVEEPGATTDELHAALGEVVREMKPVGWRQEAGRAYVLGGAERAVKILQQKPAARETDPAVLVRSAENARAKITDHGARKLRDDQKGRAYGLLDPYDLTYTQSAAAALAVLIEAPPRVTAVNHAMARALRQVGGHVDAAGNPFIDCFGRALNMQMGPMLFGLTAAAAENDEATRQFYRDLATSPPVLGIFGRGQRPYTGAPTKTADQTDYLYQSICDFWLRAAELLANENLGLHPLAYGRYTDCIDVMADRYHDASARNKQHLPGLPRANFFRGQAHTHRWLGWSCSPFIRLLANPAEKGTVGLTEAIRYARLQKGRWKNWPDLTFYVLADLLVREALSRYQSPELPKPPTGVRVATAEAGVDVSWQPVRGAVNYRVYRANTHGGPWTWLNSPYAASPVAPSTETHWHDPTGKIAASYTVIAIDAHGRESPWPDSP